MGKRYITVEVNDGGIDIGVKIMSFIMKSELYLHMTKFCQECHLGSI